jgi:hypothetical protein
MIKKRHPIRRNADISPLSVSGTRPLCYTTALFSSYAASCSPNVVIEFPLMKQWALTSPGVTSYHSFHPPSINLLSDPKARFGHCNIPVWDITAILFETPASRLHRCVVGYCETDGGC